MNREGLAWLYGIPAELAGHLRIGTCSWKYDSWKGLVYDPDKRYRPDDYLPDYAKHFTAVEIDQWFWSLFPTGARLPDRVVVKRYADSVPDNFRFTIKAPGEFQYVVETRNPNYLNPTSRIRGVKPA